MFTTSRIVFILLISILTLMVTMIVEGNHVYYVGFDVGEREDKKRDATPYPYDYA